MVGVLNCLGMTKTGASAEKG